jgi:hypothetical protein
MATIDEFDFVLPIKLMQISMFFADWLVYSGLTLVFKFQAVWTTSTRRNFGWFRTFIIPKMATIDEFDLKNIGLWWRYGISRHCDEWKYIIIGRIFESEIILIPQEVQAPGLKFIWKKQFSMSFSLSRLYLTLTTIKTSEFSTQKIVSFI